MKEQSFHVKSYGCQMNVYDSEKISSFLTKEGMVENNDIYSFDDNLDGISDYNISNPDFSFAQFNSNLVLRWEYIPGSELFLVWSQGLRNEFFPSDSLIDGIQSGIIDQRPQNIFLIKFTYRFIL